jgi:hypothetical protein
MIVIARHRNPDQNGTCPTCGKAVVIERDSDGEQEWTRAVWRACSCPMPERISDYLNKEVT